jgi:hypothetical protein
MSHSDNDRPRSSLHVWLIVAAILSPVLYVLSLGSAVRWLRDSPLDSFAAAFYSPLEWLGASCEPLGKALDWYVSLWLR